MTKSDKKEIIRLINLSEATMSDKDSVQKLIRTYIDPGYSLCKTCDAQVQAAFKRLKNWWNIQNN